MKNRVSSVSSPPTSSSDASSKSLSVPRCWLWRQTDRFFRLVVGQIPKAFYRWRRDRLNDLMWRGNVELALELKSNLMVCKVFTRKDNVTIIRLLCYWFLKSSLATQWIDAKCKSLLQLKLGSCKSGLLGSLVGSELLWRNNSENDSLFAEVRIRLSLRYVRLEVIFHMTHVLKNFTSWKLRQDWASETFWFVALKHSMQPRNFLWHFSN